jgi:hemerythrin-like metal-binding protein
MNAQTPTSPTALSWTDAFVLGFTPMDSTHAEFVRCVAAVQNATDADLPATMEALAVHLREHFAQEDQWMRETEFPPRDCHIDEHAAVLKSVQEVQALLATGDTAEPRRLAAALADWFPGHADYLDSALAHWLCKRRLGGKPVVIRRGLDLRP